MSELLKYEDTQLSNLLGLDVKVLMKSNAIVKGNIYSFNRLNNLMFLFCIEENVDKNNNNKKTVSNNIIVINIKNIKSIDLYNSDEVYNKLNKNSKISLIYKDLTKPNIAVILEKERMNIEKKILLNRSDKSNLLYKTYQKGYAIYDKLSKLYTCKFLGTKISFEELDAYIDVPFNTCNINCENEDTKELLSKLIEQILLNIK